MEHASGKPLPVVSMEGQPFWAEAANGRLVVQQCARCDHRQFPPRLLCAHCGAPDLAWVQIDGTGSIYAYTVVYRPPDPAFQEDVPYIVAIVHLAEGARLMSNITDCDVNRIHVGMEVEAYFEQVNNDLSLVKFRPR